MLKELWPHFLISLIIAQISYAITPTFITSMEGFQTGSKVFSTSAPTLSNGLQSSTTTITFMTAFTSAPTVGLGIKSLSSTFTNTASLHKFYIDFNPTTTSKTQTTVTFTRTPSIVTQAAVNYMAVSSTSFIDIYIGSFNMTSNNVYDIAASQRSSPITMTYKEKSNSTNTALIYSTIGTQMWRQRNTYEFNLAESAKYITSYTLQITVGSMNAMKWIRVCGVSYETRPIKVFVPYYIEYGFFTDFSGTISDSSSATSITTLGNIFTGMKDWDIDDSNSILDYSFTFSIRQFSLSSTSIIDYSAAYWWYRKEVCPQNYYLNAHQCDPCHITCLTCSGPLSNQCITCPQTRIHNSTNSDCLCQPGYQDTGAQACQLITCDNVICSECAAMNVCGTCRMFFNRVLVDGNCECKSYTFDAYDPQVELSNPYCSPCHHTCLTCSTATNPLLPTTCLSCNFERDHRQFVEATNSCVCTDGYFENNTAVCVACHHSCETCSDRTFCLSCNASLGRVDDETSSYCGCEPGTYDDEENQQCQPCPDHCETCSSDTVCQTCLASREIVDNDCECIDGYFQGGNPECQLCDHTCLTCIDLTRCYSCSSILHRYYDPETEFCICGPGYYDNGYDHACQQCAPSCKECTDGGTSDCTSCDETMHRQISSGYQCVCSEGFYQVDQFTPLCGSCYYTCETCTDATNCDSCNSLKFRTPDLTNSSICNCMDGYYDNASQLCIKCPSYCLTCSSSSACLTCDASTRDISNLNTCPCLPGFYDNGISSSCLPCSSSCLTCEDTATRCTSCTPLIKRLTTSYTCICAQGFLSPTCSSCDRTCKSCITTANNCNKCNGLHHRYLQIDAGTGLGSCVCQDGYYDDGTNSECAPCDPSCETCSSDSSCLTCPQNRQNDTNDIFCICKPQFFENPTSQNCLPCHYSCSSCSAYSICTTCDIYKHRVEPVTPSTCVCQDGYYDDTQNQLCPQCESTCLTCSSYSHCTSCDQDLLFRTLDTDTHSCLCSDGYYESSTTFLCEPCDYSCLTCDDANSCLTCVDDENREIKSVGGLCECKSGYFEDPNTNTCEECSYPCSQCDTTSILCTECEQSHIPSGNTCICGPGTFENTLMCEDCLPTCKTCVNASACVSCRDSDNRHKIDNDCVCRPGFHDDNGAQVICMLCDYSCLTCSEATSCDTCADIRQQPDVNSLCNCPIQRYFDDGSPQCRPCSYSCLSCDVLSTRCTDCSASAHRSLNDVDTDGVNDTCLCDDGYFDDGTQTQQCQPCDYRCHTCVDASSCSTCSSAMNRLPISQSSSSFCECKVGFFDVTNVQACSACSYTCLTCQQTSSYCTSCPTTRNYDEDTHTCACQDGTYDAYLAGESATPSAQCAPCLDSCVSCQNGNECTSCNDVTRILSGSLCICVNGHYDSGDEDCYECHPTCLQCSDYEQCTECDTEITGRELFQGECICPDGTFDDYANSGQLNCQPCHYSCKKCSSNAMCSACDSSLQRVRSISGPNAGLCQCSDGFYDDTQNQQCQTCPFDCLTCSDETTCIECADNERVLNQLTDRCECAGSFYTNGSVCQVCPPQCDTCDNLTFCTTCSGDRVLDQTFDGSGGGACVCSVGQYPVPNTDQCGSCHYSCQTCTSETSCTTCNSSLQRYKTSATSRLCKCRRGFYDDTVNELQQCQSCHYSCLSCSNGDECLTCDANLMRVLDSDTHKCKCGSGYYQDTNSLLCVQCHYTCKNCNDGSSCQQCSGVSGRTLINSQCQCPIEGYFDNEPDPICNTCDPTCLTCENSATQCTDCDSDHHRELQGSQCKCQQGYFQTSNNPICSTCSYKCLTCSSVNTQCTACSASDNRDLSTLPQCDCLVGYYDDGSTPACQLCDYRCETCSSQNTCDTCDNTTNHRTLDPVHYMCQCNDRYYDAPVSIGSQDPQCIPCHHSCLTCNHPTLCLTCQTSTRVFETYNCLCRDGYYDDGSSVQCLPCDYRCLRCDVFEECSMCDPNSHRYFQQSIGYCLCSDGYFDVGDGVTSQCGTCDTSCKTCVDQNSCSTCYPSTNQYVNATEGTQFCICLYGYYLPPALQTVIPSKKVCQPCHYSCQKCQLSSTNCIQCDSASNRVVSPQSGNCLCLQHYYDNGQDQLCYQCFTNCTTCFGPNAGQCLTCDAGTFILSGTCYVDCPQRYYNNEVDWECGACSANCLQCTDQTYCLTCQDGFLKFDDPLTQAELTCLSQCPDYFFEQNGFCIPCQEPCGLCTGVYECIDCIEGFYEAVQCYPCHQSCRYCTGGSAYDCITCVDGYFLSENGVCTKLNCLATQYVNSQFGCYDCGDTYPNSLQCSSSEPISCRSGYMIQQVTSYTNPNNPTIESECIRCNNVEGYQLIDGECDEICGDGLRIQDICDDGNTLNGDGCSSICTVEKSWECSETQCGLAATPIIQAESVKKVTSKNQIVIVLKLSIGLRLVKQNFMLIFGKAEKFKFEVKALNNKYTRFQLIIQYEQTIAKDTLNIKIISPIQTSRLLTPYHRLLQQLTTPITIDLSLDLQIAIITKPPAVYYPQSTRSMFTSSFFITLIVLHLIAILCAAILIFFFRLKLMLLVIELFNSITILYVYSGLGMFSVSELAAEASRALQHFVYPFGDLLIDDSTSFYYFSYTQFILASIIIQIVILLVLSILKLYYGGSSNNEDEERYDKFRYYHLGFLYSFSFELFLACVIVFTWVDFSSLQGSYSWAIAIILFVLLLMDNGFYMVYVSAYKRKLQSIQPEEHINQKYYSPVKLKSGATLMNATRKTQGRQDVNQTNMLSIHEQLEVQSGKQNEKGEGIDDQDPFAQEQDNMQSQTKTNANIFNPFDKQEQEGTQKQQKINQKMLMSRRSSQVSLRNRDMEQNDKVSQRSATTAKTDIDSLVLVQMYDLVPKRAPHIDKAYVNYFHNYLHWSYLPIRCVAMPILLAIATQIQEPIARCSLLIIIQIVFLCYLIPTSKIKNTRTIKLILTSVALLTISIMGLIGAINTESSSQQFDQKLLYRVQLGLVITVLISMAFSITIFILQVLKSPEYRQYKIQKRNQEIIQKNIRKNRLRNIGNSHDSRNVTGIKTIFHKTNIDKGLQERQQTKINFRMDSETPAEMAQINSSSNILFNQGNSGNNVEGWHNRVQNLAVVDIEDLEYEEMREEQRNNKKGSNFNSEKHKNEEDKMVVNKKKYSQMHRKADSMMEKQQKIAKELQMMENERENTHNLQSTRVKAQSRLKSRQNRFNNFLSRLENELIAEEETTTVIFKKNINKEESGDSMRRDDTLISIKQNEYMQSKRKKQDLLNQPKSSNIIKNLIPTRQYDEDPNLQKSKKVNKYFNPDQQQSQQQADDIEEHEVVTATKVENNKSLKSKHYQYEKGNKKAKNNKVKKSQKHVVAQSDEEDESQEQQDHRNNEIKVQNINKRKEQTYKFAKQQISDDQQEMQYQKRKAQHMKNEQQIDKKEQVELPGGIKDDGFDDGDQDQLQKGMNNRKIKDKHKNNSKSKGKPTANRPKEQLKPRKPHPLKRIDSISSIGDDHHGTVERELEQQSYESEGVSVFKKILQDYQIYKDKKVRGNILKKKKR